MCVVEPQDFQGDETLHAHIIESFQQLLSHYFERHQELNQKLAIQEQKVEECEKKFEIARHASQAFIEDLKGLGIDQFCSEDFIQDLTSPEIKDESSRKQVDWLQNDFREKQKEIIMLTGKAVDLLSNNLVEEKIEVGSCELLG